MISIQSIPAKQAWPIRHTVLSPNNEFKNLGFDESKARTFGLFDNDELISVASCQIDENQALLRKFGTALNRQKKGYGSILLKHLIQYSKAAGMKKLSCYASASSITFYQRLGFKETQKTAQQDGVNFVLMELDLETP